MKNFVFLIEKILWSYVALPLLLIIGIYLTIKLKFPQFTKFKFAVKCFVESLLNLKKNKKRGVSPLIAFFTSIGGCIGIANLIGVCSAIKIGGPGAIIWMWVAAFLGMAVKYSEVKLSIKFREKNKSGSYDGGPMYYLQKVFNNKILSVLVSLFLAFYAVEIYMFKIIVDSIHTNWGLNFYLTVGVLLFLVLYAGSGGISRVGYYCSIIIPVFLMLFIFFSLFVIYKNYNNILNTISIIFKSAFSGHAALGGFAGSTLLLSMSKGIERGCYTGDIGIGYAGMVHAETSESDSSIQSSFTILGIFIDTFIICTFTTFIIILTGVWKSNNPASMMTQITLSKYFPHMNIYMPFFIFLLGYSSIIAFFAVGIKCANFISNKWGKKIYYIYSIISFIIFSFVDSEVVLGLMSIAGGFLLCINIYGIFKLKKNLIDKT